MTKNTRDNYELSLFKRYLCTIKTASFDYYKQGKHDDELRTSYDEYGKMTSSGIARSQRKTPRELSEA
jgi:hypothetical protein